MNQVEADKEKLRVKLNENRAKHAREYDEAWAGYESSLAEQAAVVQEAATAQPFNAQNLREAAQKLVKLPKPEDHTDDYDRALVMLEWETRPVIELSEWEFRQFVEDEWNWKQDFATTNALYSSGSALG